MSAIIITIGDEILIGQVLNTNAAWLSKKLLSIGFSVDKMLTIPDNERVIYNAFISAFKKYDIIIITGGLGPTHDDITKKCIVKAFSTKLVLDNNILNNIKTLFSRRKINMPENNYEQAMIPKISTPLKNKYGTAPGILIHRKNKIFCALPGVPYEMEYITESSLLPYLKKHFKSGKIILQRTLHTIGISESSLYNRIGNIDDLLKSNFDCEIKLAFLPANNEIRLRITVKANSKSVAQKQINNVIKQLKGKAGDYIYSLDESPIENVIGKLLRKKKLTISCAESCTGGLITSKITNVPGSSEYFLGSVISYSNDMKMKELKVKNSTLKRYGAVSTQTAIEMAEGMRKLSNSDISLSSTGIAGPSGGSRNKPVGLVWFGYSDNESTFAKEFIFTKDRLRNKEIMSKMVLEILRRKLLGLKV